MRKTLARLAAFFLSFLFFSSCDLAIVSQADSPLISPESGEYVDDVLVTITCPTSGSAIYFTTDGSDPRIAGRPYAEPFAIQVSSTLSAYAVAASFEPSEVASATYVINRLHAATPVLSLPAGTYNDYQTVSISCAMPDATIRYTLDGTVPTTASAVFSSPLFIDRSLTLSAVAVVEGLRESDAASAAYALVASAPTFSLPDGNYNSIQSVAVSTATPDAAIHFTTDGSAPTDASPLFTIPLVLDTDTTLRAIAVKTGLSDSLISTAAYSINPTVVVLPAFLPSGGTFSNDQTVSIGCLTAGSSIYYTTDGASPTETSTYYSGPFVVASSCMVRARAYRSGFTPSSIAEANFVMTTAAPEIDPAGGTYESDQIVGITCSTTPVELYYTTNGDDPTQSSTPYLGPFTVDGTCVVRARAFRSGYNPSGIASASFTMAVAAPAISPAAGLYNSFQSVSISCSTTDADIYFTTNGDAPTTSSTPYAVPFEVSSSCTVRARAYRSGYNASAIADAVYTINLNAADTPTISPAGGTFDNDHSVSITCTMPTADIRYTTNGAEPTESSQLYTASFTVNSSCTVRARAYRIGYDPSAIASAVFTLTVATPAISPDAGTYTASQTVSITDITTDAAIYYTTNGSDPTQSSTRYEAPFTVGVSCTVQARAYKDGYTASGIAQAAYTIDFPDVATPVISPSGGTHSNDQTVSITCATPSAAIYYTTNGAEPTTFSTPYENPFQVAGSSTVRARAYRSAYDPSAIASAVFTLTVATPAISPDAGTYTASQTVSITDTTTDAAIYYTTNGDDPTQSSTRYEAPFTVGVSCTVRARAYKDGYTASGIAQAAYTIDFPDVATPVISPSGGTHSNDQTVSITCATPSAAIYYTTNGAEPTESSQLYTASFTVSSPSTVRARAYRNAYDPSAIAEATFTMTTATPLISPAGGTFSTAQTLTLSCPTTGASIFYTTNGSDPTQSSTRYEAPFTVGASCTVRARAYRTNYSNSSVAQAIFTINGTMGLTITFVTPQNETITYEQNQNCVIDKSVTTSFTVSIAESFDSYVWYLDAAYLSGQTASSLILDASALTVGIHRAQCYVTHNGSAYSKELVFRIVP